MSSLDSLIQVLLSGTLLGGLYGLASVGLSLVYGVMDLLNAAHGEFIVLGGYLTYWLFSLFGLSPFLSIFFTIPIIFVIGAIIEKVLIHRVIEFPMALSFIVTYGLSLIIENGEILAWTMNYRAIDYFTPSYTLGNLIISFSRMEIFAVALTGFILLHLLLTKTNVGRAIRAVSENKEAARLMGISVSRMYLYAFSLSAVLGSVAGCMLAILFPFNPLTGRPFLLKAFSIIVLGGMGSIIGCLVGGIIVGIAETAIGFYVGMTWKDIGALVMLFAILMVKPKGIFGKR